MTRKTTAITVVLACAVALLLATGLWAYLRIWAPYARLNDLEWLETASADELRSTCHRVLASPIDDPHDACLYLEHIGDAESVPLLIDALECQDPPEDGIVVCTTGHCVDALKALTGKDFGRSHEDWARWWREEGSRLPPGELGPGSDP